MEIYITSSIEAIRTLNGNMDEDELTCKRSKFSVCKQSNNSVIIQPKLVNHQNKGDDRRSREHACDARLEDHERLSFNQIKDIEKKFTFNDLMNLNLENLSLLKNTMISEHLKNGQIIEMEQKSFPDEMLKKKRINVVESRKENGSPIQKCLLRNSSKISSHKYKESNG